MGDGALLKELDDDILREELQIKNRLHRKKLLLEIATLFKTTKSKNNSVAKPKRTWENSPKKTAKRGRPKKTEKKESEESTEKKKKPKNKKRVIRTGKRACPGCEKNLDKDIVMCGSCNYVFPESKAARFKATSYFRTFVTEPNYN